MINYLAAGISLIVYAALSILNYFNYAAIEESKSIALALILFGLISISRSLGKMNRSSLFLISFILNGGIILYFINEFEILNHYDIVLAVLLYFVGAGFFLIFVENTREIRILVIALFFLVLSFITIMFNGESGLIKLANRITLILFDYWSLFLIIFGVILAASKNRTVR